MQRNLVGLADANQAIPPASHARLSGCWLLGLVGAFLMEGGVLCLVLQIPLPHAFAAMSPSLLGAAVGAPGAALMLWAAARLKRA